MRQALTTLASSPLRLQQVNRSCIAVAGRALVSTKLFKSLLGLKERLPDPADEPQRDKIDDSYNGPRLLKEQLRILFFGRDLPLGGNQLQSLRGVFSPRDAGRGELEADQDGTRQS
jgi:hypothetical protein